MLVEEVKTIAVLGTGMMGPGIGLQFARAGFKVSIWGPNAEEVERGKRNLKRNIDDLIREQIVSSSQGDRAHANIQVVSELEEAAGSADFVSEAIIENLEIKQEMFARLEMICPNHTVLTSNTSTLLPSSLNRKMKQKDRLLVAHFWNPAHLAPLVEVCGSSDTSSEAIDLTMKLLAHIGNEPVLMKKEVLGFIGNRIMHAMNREALAMVSAGVATAEEIDKAILASFGPRFANLGLLEYLDFCGLDNIGRIQEYLYKDLDTTSGALPVIKDKIARGDLGAKTGQGLFDWSKKDLDGPRIRRDQEFLRRAKTQSTATVASS